MSAWLNERIQWVYRNAGEPASAGHGTGYADLNQLAAAATKGVSLRTPLVIATLAVMLAGLVACWSKQRDSEPSFQVRVRDSHISIPTNYDVRIAYPDNVLELTRGGTGGYSRSKIYVGRGNVLEVVTTPQGRSLLGVAKRRAVGKTELLSWQRPFNEMAPNIHVSVVKYRDYEVVIFSDDPALPVHLAETITKNSISTIESTEKPTTFDERIGQLTTGSKQIVTMARPTDAEALSQDGALGVLFQQGVPVGYVLNAAPPPGSLLQRLGVESNECLLELIRRSPHGTFERHTAQSDTLLTELAEGGEFTLTVRGKDGGVRSIQATVSPGVNTSEF